MKFPNNPEKKFSVICTIFRSEKQNHKAIDRLMLPASHAGTISVVILFLLIRMWPGIQSDTADNHKYTLNSTIQVPVTLGWRT